MKNVTIPMLILGVAAMVQAQVQAPLQAPVQTPAQTPAQQPPAQATPPAASAPAVAPGPPPTKIAVISLEQALLATKEGQKAANGINAKYAPRKADLDRRQAEISGLQDQLRKGSATMSDDARSKLQRDVDAKTKLFQRDTQDAQEEVQQDENKVMQDLQGKMQAIVAKYCSENGYAAVLAVSQAGAVFWISQSTDITPEMIKLYDDAHPVAAPAAAAPAKPSGQPPALPKR